MGQDLIRSTACTCQITLIAETEVENEVLRQLMGTLRGDQYDQFNSVYDQAKGTNRYKLTLSPPGLAR